MNITLKINGIEHTIDTAPSMTLLGALRGLGFHGVKFGDEGGLSGADTILLMANLSMRARSLQRRRKVTASPPSKRWANIPNRVGRKPMDYIHCKRLLLSQVPFNAVTVRPRKFSQRRVCWRKIRTHLRRRSVRRSQESSAAVPGI